MKKILLLIIAILFVCGPAFADYVNGYTRSNGTYVRGHYRSKSDGYKFNNYSTRGNYNPYTGTKGYRNPSFRPRVNTYRPYKSKMLNY